MRNDLHPSHALWSRLASHWVQPSSGPDYDRHAHDVVVCDRQVLQTSSGVPDPVAFVLDDEEDDDEC